MKNSVCTLVVCMSMFFACGEPENSSLKNTEPDLFDKFLSAYAYPSDQPPLKDFASGIVNKVMERQFVPDIEVGVAGKCLAFLKPTSYAKLNETVAGYKPEGIEHDGSEKPYVWFSSENHYKPQDCRSFFEAELQPFMGRQKVSDQTLSPDDYVVTFFAMGLVNSQ